MKKGSILTLDIEKFADRGKSLTRLDGYVIFVPGAVPGDRVKARVFRKRKKFAEAALLEVIEPSPLRTEAKCSYFGTCGGCKWQHVTYEAQLDAKTQSVKESFEHAGGRSDVTVHPALGADDTFYYRNKMEFSFSAGRWLTPAEIKSGEDFNTSFALGLHVPGNFAKVLDLHECHLQSEWSASFVNAMRAYSLERDWKAWHPRKHTGFLRHLVIRQATHTEEVMVNLVTNHYDEERMQELAAWIQETAPGVTTFINTINSGVAQTAFGEEMHVVFGPGVIHDRIGDHTFEIASNAFFQTNTRQAETLYRVAAEYANFTPDDLVYDLYCGAGTISLYVAPNVKHVVGVELVEEAVQNARRNAEANGISNVTFETGDMMKLFNDDFIAKHGKPDVLIVDPPRAGLHPKVVRQIGELAPERFVYVSCNPQSQAKDLSYLTDQFEVVQVQPVDLFPHTHHIESVAQLKLRT
ncbi:MAG: 23S rRNA (uracil(1939)-C(5))-methyltransferase RlmD [Rhodothermales bacterium]